MILKTLYSQCGPTTTSCKLWAISTRPKSLKMVSSRRGRSTAYVSVPRCRYHVRYRKRITHRRFTWLIRATAPSSSTILDSSCTNTADHRTWECATSIWNWIMHTRCKNGWSISTRMANGTIIWPKLWIKQLMIFYSEAHKDAQTKCRTSRASQRYLPDVRH